MRKHDLTNKNTTTKINKKKMTVISSTNTKTKAMTMTNTFKEHI